MTTNTNGPDNAGQDFQSRSHTPVKDCPPHDAKGRPAPIAMSDRRMLEEILLSQRYVQDTVESLLGSMQSNPMMRAMVGKVGK